MRKKSHFAIGLIALASLLSGAPAFGQLPEKSIGAETISLQGPTTWTLSKLTLAEGAVILTNGHPLTIVVTGDLTVNGTATIKSFSGTERALTKQVPHKAADGGNGVSHNRGPESEGAGPGNRGADGGHGAPGTPGSNGNKGRDASVVTIVVSGTAKGKLVVRNTGMDGQPGGAAGNGGRGGNGQQGGRGIPNKGPFGIVLGAKSGPGGGGNGGNGGNGGAGGRGGDAGNGGTLSLNVLGNKDKFSLEINLHAGKLGSGGPGGGGGGAGEFGWGGRGTVGVHGRVEERKCGAGHPGAAGPGGASGSAGQDGRFEGNVKPIVK